MGKKLTWLLFLLSAFLAAEASHLKGGWIKYAYMGPTSGDITKSHYKVTVYQYLSCASSPTQIDSVVYISVYSGTSFISTKSVRRSGGSIASRSDFPCVSPAQTICYRIDEYETEYDFPNNPEGYTFAVQRCSRIQNLVNIINSVNTGITYTTAIPGITNNAYQNKSAVFSLDDAVVVCAGNSFSFPFVATDPDGDSLSYRFTEGKDVAVCVNTAFPQIVQAPPPYPNINYQPPYSAAQPLGNTVAINPATGIISGIAPATIGDYVVAVAVDEFRNGVKIAENRKEIHIGVRGCNIPSADLPIRPVTCNGFTVDFQNTSPSSSITSYNWDFGVPGVTTDSSTQPTPTYTYQDTGVYTVTLVVNQGQPCTNTGTQQVRVYPGFFPGFTFAAACKGIPFQFTDTTRTSYGYINSWSWNFGDGNTLSDTSHLQNPQYTYQNTGTDSVRLVVTNSKGCIDTALVAVSISDKPQLILAFKDTLICNMDTLQLHARSNAEQGIFTWSPNYRISSLTDPNPFVNPLITTKYTVTINDRGCVASDTVSVNVLDFISVNAGPDTTICLTDSVTLRPVSQALSYRWTPAATLSNPNTKFPVATPTATFTTYVVQAALGKCQAIDSIVVKTAPYPRANAGADTIICFGDKVLLHGTISGSGSIWQPAQFVQNPPSLSTLAFPRTTTSFVLIATDTLGCPKPIRDSVLVTVQMQPVVFAGNDTTIIIGQPLVMNASASSFLTRYKWSPPTGISNDTLLRPGVVITPALYPPNGQLKYTLTATSNEGCTGSDEIIVRVLKAGPTIFVPGAFTPNGDGNNDVFKPILAGLQQLNYFRVYNRYGQLLYQTSTIGQGWDGRVNGILQDNTGYVYSVQASNPNGTIINKTGSFVLVR